MAENESPSFIENYTARSGFYTVEATANCEYGLVICIRLWELGSRFTNLKKKRFQKFNNITFITSIIILMILVIFSCCATFKGTFNSKSYSAVPCTYLPFERTILSKDRSIFVKRSRSSQSFVTFSQFFLSQCVGCFSVEQASSISCRSVTVKSLSCESSKC